MNITSNLTCFRRSEELEALRPLIEGLPQEGLTTEQKKQKLTYERHLLRNGYELEENRMPLLVKTLDKMGQLAREIIADRPQSQEIKVCIDEIDYSLRISENTDGTHAIYVRLDDSLSNLELGSGTVKIVRLGIKLADLTQNYQPVAITNLHISSLPDGKVVEQDKEKLLRECRVGNELRTTFGIDAICPFTNLSSISPEDDTITCVADLCLGTYWDLKQGVIWLERNLKIHNANSLFEALQAVHQANFVHRDISAGNCFIDLTGQAKLGDWGSAENRTLCPRYTVFPNSFKENCNADREDLKITLLHYSFSIEEEKEAALPQLHAIFEKFGVS